MPLFVKVCETVANSPATNEKIARLAPVHGQIMARLISSVRVEMSTFDIAELARQAAKESDTAFSFASTMNFPDDVSICRNHEVMNGVPSKSALIKAGDTLKISFGTHEALGAFCTQTWTMHVGESTPAQLGLLTGTRDSMLAAVDICRPGVLISDIVSHIEEQIQARGLILSREFAGHLVGDAPIMPPQLIKPAGLVGRDYRLKEGSVLSLFVLAHSAKPRLALRDDGWTVADRDRNLSAAYSHLIRVGDGQPMTLTSAHALSARG